MPPVAMTAATTVTEHNLLTDLTLGQLLAIIATLAVIVGFIRSVNPVMHRLNDMLDDWNGQRARPGVPERPGVMERLSGQDEVLSHLRKTVEPLVDDTQAGNHLEVLKRLDGITDHTQECGSHLTRLERLLRQHIREATSWRAALKDATAQRGFVMPEWPDLPDDDEGK